MGRKGDNPGPDAEIARLAANQHGVVSVAQLEEAGIRERGRARRVSANRLHRIHRSVYGVGHRGLSKEGFWMAAVLACGEGAALSHISAGELWGILRRTGRPSSAGVRVSVPHVTVPGNARQRRGIVLHRSRTLTEGEVTRRLNIRVTKPSRTLVDLRRVLPRQQFVQALRQAEFLGLPLDPGLGADRTRSELEARFLSICRRHRLPGPEVNVGIGEFTVDFLWRDRRLVVELDGYRAHRGRSAFEADRIRDLEIRLLGYEVVRFTWRQLDDPRSIAVALRALLTRPHPA